MDEERHPFFDNSGKKLRSAEYSCFADCGYYHSEFGIGGQTARLVHGGQHPVSTSALRNARSRNEFNALSQPVGRVLSPGGSGRGIRFCFGFVLFLSSRLDFSDSMEVPI